MRLEHLLSGEDENLKGFCSCTTREFIYYIREKKKPSLRNRYDKVELDSPIAQLVRALH